MEVNADLTVRELRVRALDLRLRQPMETASGTMASAPIVLIDLVTEQGVVGTSYIRCYTPLALHPLAQLVRNLAPLLAGASAAPAAVEQKLQRCFRILGPQGLTGMAMAGIDMALWDALAKAHGVPLVTLLGGEPKPVAAYASLRTMHPQSAAREAAEVRALGFTAIKVKVGRSDVAADVEVIRAIRSAAGDDVHLMLDYNQSLSVPEAIDRVRVLDDENLYWIEEPTRADDFEGHACIARAAKTAIQLGENWWGPSDMEKSIAAGASDHAMLDAMKLGGVTGWLRAAALANAAGLPASSHTFPEFSVHLLGVTPTAHWLEYLDHVGTILAEPIAVRDGYALTPDRPGAGIVWNEELLEHLLEA